MFNNQRYMTKGIQATIPVEIQICLWNLIDSMNVEKDYLQVFTLSESDGKQKITHSQEEPEYEQEYMLDCNEAVKAKIFVIDDVTHSTMLLADEY